MIDTKVINGIKEYCESEYKWCTTWGRTNVKIDIEKAIDRCYGAIMAIQYIDWDYEIIGEWWEDEMLPKFQKLQKERR